MPCLWHVTAIRSKGDGEDAPGRTVENLVFL